MITTKYTQEQKDAFDPISAALEDDNRFQQYKESFYLEDQGIGSYEYWGFKGVDVQLVPVSEDGDFEVDLDFDIPKFDYFSITIEVEVTHRHKVSTESVDLIISYVSKNRVHVE